MPNATYITGWLLDNRTLTDGTAESLLRLLNGDCVVGSVVDVAVAASTECERAGAEMFTTALDMLAALRQIVRIGGTTAETAIASEAIAKATGDPTLLGQAL